MKKELFIEKYGEEAWQRNLANQRAWQKKNKDAVLEKHKAYYQANKEQIKERVKQHYQDNKDQILSYQKKKYNEDPSQKKNYVREYREKTDYNKKYKGTKKGRAANLVSAYKIADKKAGRNKCTLSRDWIVEKIFSTSCVYCGDSDWLHLGCDRIDNTQPHTPENCICACGICNIEREIQKMSVAEFRKYRETHPRAV